MLAMFRLAPEPIAMVTPDGITQFLTRATGFRMTCTMVAPHIAQESGFTPRESRSRGATTTAPRFIRIRQEATAATAMVTLPM